MAVLNDVREISGYAVAPHQCADSSRRIEAACQLGLSWQAAHQDFLGRIAVVERSGMSRASLQEVVALMTKKRVHNISTDSGDARRRFPFGNPWTASTGRCASFMRSVWNYCHLTDADEPLEWCRWGQGYWIERQHIEVGSWFSRERFAVTRLDSLRASIPYGVMLRVNELRSECLFDCFSVVAPEELVKRLPAAPIDPIVIGSLYNRSYSAYDANDHGGEAHFVIAQWT